MAMDQVRTGTVHGNTIVFDSPLAVPDGQVVEVVVRDRRAPMHQDAATGCSDDSQALWWTSEDDRILEEIYQSRKQSTRREIPE
jgi:hypothetical protein